MKKSVFATIGLSVLLIVCLISLGIYLNVKLRADMNTSDAVSAQALLDAESSLQELSELTSGEQQSGTDNITREASRLSETNIETQTESEEETEWALDLMGFIDPPLIWVGDSRTVGMQKAVGIYSEDCFIGAAGEGYNWLIETGLPLMESAIASYPSRPVIFNMGVNDYENLYNYMVLYEEITSDYPDTVFYFLSVNPIDDDQGLYITNAEIENFNSHLSAAYPDTYLDSYSYLMENGAETIDGIHYSEEDYRLIYLFVKKEII